MFILRAIKRLFCTLKNLVSITKTFKIRDRGQRSWGTMSAWVEGCFPSQGGLTSIWSPQQVILTTCLLPLALGHRRPLSPSRGLSQVLSKWPGRRLGRAELFRFYSADSAFHSNGVSLNQPIPCPYTAAHQTHSGSKGDRRAVQGIPTRLS
jgi:hypothetical protein